MPNHVKNTLSFSGDPKKISEMKEKIKNDEYGIDLKIPEHTTTAIVGPSVGGKTTLTNLMARFWDVKSGEVLLGGKNVKEYSFDSLMRNFSFVLKKRSSSF